MSGREACPRQNGLAPGGHVRHPRSMPHLTVDALLTGGVVQHGDTIQVSADLTNVKDNTEIWGEHYERKHQ